MVKIARDDTFESLVRQAAPSPGELQSVPSRRLAPLHARTAMMAAAISRILEQQVEANPTEYLKQRQQQSGE